MGVLTDYFRAPSRATVIAALGDDPYSPLDKPSGFDGLALKGIDDAVLLVRLVAAILDTEWSLDLADSTVIYPPAETKPSDWTSLPADSPWATEPWVTELSAETRGVLASLEPERVPSVAAEWASAEEFHGTMPLDYAAETIVALKELATRAAAADELLYCWICL
jgi:hypothetical protein